MSSDAQCSSPRFEAMVESNVMVPLRDGVQLATDLYFPAINGERAPGQFPVVLTRTPYDKTNHAATGAFYAERGYIAAMQDTRGRYMSEGEFYAFAHEGPDGYDAVEWLAAQPWCNGKVGTLGASYEAAVQSALASLNPPHLAAMVVTFGPHSYYHCSMRQNGALEQRFFVYAFTMAATSKEAMADPVLKAALDEAAGNIWEWVRALPMRKGASPLRLVPSYEDWCLDLLSHVTYDDYWRLPGYGPLPYYDQHADVPTLYVGGWYDTYTRATVTNFQELSKRKRAPVHMLMGPWHHGGVGIPSAGDVSFRPNGGLSHYESTRLQWFDQYYYYAINGITDDMGWAATHAGADPAWLELTLPEPAQIGRVVIHTPNLKDYDLRFQGPDGQVSEAQIRGNEETVAVHRFDPPVPCLKLRITAISARNVPGASARQVSEIEAYGDPGEGPITPLVTTSADVQLPDSPIPDADAVETNVLWADDFTDFNPRDKFAWDGKDEWVVDPAKHTATPLPGGGIKCRSIEGGSGMARIFPYDPAYRFFQVNLRDIEGTGYRFVNVGFSSSSGKPGYRGAINTSRPGIYTVDTHYINEAYRTGAEKTCFVRTYQAQVDVTFDWFRLVQRPLNGLAVMMADGSPLPEALERGDQVMFHLILEDPATDVAVDVLANSMYSPLQINGQPYVQLFRMTPDGREWGAVVTLGEGTTPFDQTKAGYPVVFRARIVGGSIAETYASASVSIH